MVSTSWGKLGSERNTRIKTFINQFKLAELSFSVSLFFLESVIYCSYCIEIKAINHMRKLINEEALVYITTIHDLKYTNLRSTGN